ncbi:endo-beta-1,6-glucanase [Xylariomycetidae sp. FL2044]|nr:endo-beta-1,6-glucanase [Xylariomycetidae sp. FL2044]
MLLLSPSAKIFASLAVLCSVAQAWLPGDAADSVKSVTGRRGRTLSSSSEPADSANRRWMNDGKVRGVNLGSLFIMEKWMASTEWESMGCGSAESEWDCVKALGQDKADSAFQKHWGSWITEGDLDQMKDAGLNAVRIPIGFWMDESLVNKGEYYPKGGEKYLLQVCGWASDRGMYIMLEMHGAPGVQAKGQSFTGHSTDDAQFFTNDNYQRGVKFLKYLVKLVHDNSQMRNVGMIGVVNEPDRDHGDLITNYYPNAYGGVRGAESSAGTQKKLHIAFMGTSWGAGSPKQNLPSDDSLAFEDHRYFRWDTSVPLTHNDYTSNACWSDRTSSGEAPTLVSEWSLAPPESVENSDGDWTRDNNKDFYKKFFEAQVIGYEKSAAGWFFWSWKTNTGDWRWDYQAALAAKVIPADLSKVASSGAC